MSSINCQFCCHASHIKYYKCQQHFRYEAHTHTDAHIFNSHLKNTNTYMSTSIYVCVCNRYLFDFLLEWMKHWLFTYLNGFKHAYIHTYTQASIHFNLYKQINEWLQGMYRWLNGWVTKRKYFFFVLCNYLLTYTYTYVIVWKWEFVNVCIWFSITNGWIKSVSERNI